MKQATLSHHSNRRLDVPRRPIQQWAPLLCVLYFLAVPGMAETDASSMVEDLLLLLDGEYESRRQMEQDKANDEPDDRAHGWVNRTFRRVDAPAVGPAVMVGTTSYAGENWVFDQNEFLVWTFHMNGTDTAVRMLPQRFKAQDARVPFAREADKLSGFSSDDLQTAISGSSCEIVWTPTERGFVGHSQPCHVMSTTRHVMLHWSWKYELLQDAIWIQFSGKNDAGDMLDGSPPGLPYRLDRMP